MRKQVDKSHYDFSNYMTKRRWISIWHQLDEVIALEPESVLEIGPGPGVFKTLASMSGLSVETLDIDADLKPDHVALADNMPFEDDTFDVVCAFQMLEHIPYEKSLEVFREMARVAKCGVVISLPDALPAWIYWLYVPKIGQLKFLLPRPFNKTRQHSFDGQHYWEINKKGYMVKQVMRDLRRASGMQLVRSYRVLENPYHRFFVFKW